MKNKIAFSIDMDDWYHSPLVCGANFSHFPSVSKFFAEWQGRYDYITESTKKLLHLLDEFNVTATIFVIADIVDNYPHLTEMLQKSGHEIACHSLHHTIPYHSKTKEQIQSVAEWESELVKSIEILQKTFNREIIGYRAPGAYLADWMIPILIRNGIKYDSSVAFNSIYNKTNVKLENIPGYPYYLDEKTLGRSDRNEGLMELPWSNFQTGKYILPGGGAYFFRLLGFHYFKTLLKQRLKEGDTMFYIHSIDVGDEAYPLTNFRKRPFFWVNKGQKTLARLKKLLEAFDGQFVSCREVYFRNIEKYKNNKLSEQ